MFYKKYKSLILDRDGIINEIILRDNVVSSPWNINEFKFIIDHLNIIKKIIETGVEVSIATNQPDVSRGNLSKKELAKMNALIKRELGISNINICHHDNHHNCDCRKPKPGMLNEILSKSKVSKRKTLMVGDSHKDVSASLSAGIDVFFLETSYNFLYSNISPTYSSKKLSDLINYYSIK